MLYGISREMLLYNNTDIWQLVAIHQENWWELNHATSTSYTYIIRNVLSQQNVHVVYVG
jgi:hypothetical protein